MGDLARSHFQAAQPAPIAEGPPLVVVGTAVVLEARVTVHVPIARLVIGYMIKDRLGQPVFGTNTDHMQRPLTDLEAGTHVAFRFRFSANIGPGSYSIAVALHSTDSHVIDNYEWRDLALVFDVVNAGHPSFVGNAWLPPQVEVERVPHLQARP